MPAAVQSLSQTDLESDQETTGRIEAHQGPPVAWLALWAATGLVEGFAMVKCLIPYPKVLADQFVFRNWVVLKMFLSAVGFSMLAQGFMARRAPETFGESRFYGLKRFGYGRVAAGLSILGAGMGLGGTGPTMILPALGGLVDTAWCLVLGGLLAALLVGLADRACAACGASWTLTGQPLEEKPLVLEAVLTRAAAKGEDDVVPYSGAAWVMGAGMVLAAVALEAIFDFREDARKYGGALAQPYPASVLAFPAWPPTVAGLVIGLGQVPVRMVSGDGMGGATAFVVVVSTLSGGLVSPQSSLCKSLANAWQLAYNWIFVFAGALLAGVVVGPPAAGVAPDGTAEEALPALTDGFPAARMVVAAFLGIAGARIAGGCTCGHGVSGTSELSVESFIGAGAIFGAAIVTRCVLVFGLGIDY